MEMFLIAPIAYLIGSIPSGLILGKLFWNTDLRKFGSKNIGATNAYRTLGIYPAIIIFAADFVKGILGVLLGIYFLNTPIAMIIGGIAVIIGHNWSLFLRFSGGKGVATGLGVIAILMPIVTLAIFIVWVLIVVFTKYVSLASIVAAGLVPILAYFWIGQIEYIIFSALAAGFVIYRHKSNIIRLLKGTEVKIKAGNK
ncbi:glycerol-3-phosphate 1-O-acyltransferase PlsY [Anaerosinus gibii]|uniref:Glycerol-3-phosphate acyltransferase n=1 Tax=Selenobaculum gibii TaxID=3054208 RepID=A0A9Y2AGP7_9FIRM|nr:glycerol-3-phosphate 1-O-acyltransferase PlsY [Selenobaculum gbiensis]WIW69623.1 glycerol-3-phosphate 1-O-acyltransferase PlsY [Selenobaculum gbiensis]